MDSRISATTSLYAFIGSPAHHSKSPIMHNLAFKELNIDSVYLAFDIKPEQLEDTIKSFKILKVQGSNVSMPHKEAIIPYLDEISTASRLCNAVNTIKLIDNHYYGTITDGIGFIKAINEQGWDIVNKKITIVGAGGACKAIMVQMALDGASEIIVYNRSKKDEFIKIINNTIKETNCKIEFKLLSDLDSLKQDMHNSYLFINTTGVGMEPMLDQSVVPDESYFSCQLKVADIIYQPATTKLLQMAKNAGCRNRSKKMKELILATTNQGKLKEIKAMLKDIDIDVLSMKDVLDQEIDIEETGTTFKENALIKASTIAKIVNKPVLADDSGLEVDALDKQPGIYSSRFLGEDTSYDIKNQYIIDAIKGKERSARFVCAMALVIPDKEPIIIEETMEGLINDKIEGENGFGYDPIFYFPPCKMTSAMMSMEEKNKYSHRAKALKKLYSILKEML